MPKQLTAILIGSTITLILIISILFIKGIPLKNIFFISKRTLTFFIISMFIIAIFMVFNILLLQNYRNFSLLINAIFITLTVTFKYSIYPLQFLFASKKNNNSIALEKEIAKKGFRYKVKVINLKKTNAFATGILPFYKLIFIDEKLLKTLTNKQTLSIIYHEIGHHELYHLKKQLLLSIILSLIFMFILMQSNTIYTIIGIPVFGFLVTFLPLKIQYKYEFQADTFSAKINSKIIIIEALKKFDEISKGRISKGGISHPTLLKRIENINNEK